MKRRKPRLRRRKRFISCHKRLWIARKIRYLIVDEDYPPAQAAAIAYREAGLVKKGRKKKKAVKRKRRKVKCP